ncbi:uncharacterized protein LOC123500156 [Portunus trituberculatus]|uniref:uncharacterized protein LOC123500156 n=1 Tax=Portunus trituberculatus TaxID=210409 RepID=UPI001E1D0DEA|nr:uncharacterized protein LOC123500156 [Portunus trituberculatus]
MVIALFVVWYSLCSLQELPIQRPDPEEILRHLYHQDQDQDQGGPPRRGGERSQLVSREWVRMARLAVVVVVVVVVVLAAAAAGRPDYTLSHKFIEMLQSEQSTWKVVSRYGGRENSQGGGGTGTGR